MTLTSLINKEVAMYVEFCRLASQHDAHEQQYRDLAHMLFYHIQEMRSTGQISVKRLTPISSTDSYKCG